MCLSSSTLLPLPPSTCAHPRLAASIQPELGRACRSLVWTWSRCALIKAIRRCRQAALPSTWSRCPKRSYASSRDRIYEKRTICWAYPRKWPWFWFTLLSQTLRDRSILLCRFLRSLTFLQRWERPWLCYFSKSVYEVFFRPSLCDPCSRCKVCRAFWSASWHAQASCLCAQLLWPGW